MRELTNCGTLKMGLGYSPILCDNMTGDVVYDSDVLGKCLFSNVAVTDGVLMADTIINNIMSQLEPEGYIGVIVTNTYLIKLKEGKAYYCSFVDTTKVLHVVDFDLDTEYEYMD